MLFASAIFTEVSSQPASTHNGHLAWVKSLQISFQPDGRNVERHNRLCHVVSFIIFWIPSLKQAGSCRHSSQQTDWTDYASMKSRTCSSATLSSWLAVWPRSAIHAARQLWAARRPLPPAILWCPLLWPAPRRNNQSKTGNSPANLIPGIFRRAFGYTLS